MTVIDYPAAVAQKIVNAIGQECKVVVIGSSLPRGAHGVPLPDVADCCGLLAAYRSDAHFLVHARGHINETIAQKRESTASKYTAKMVKKIPRKMRVAGTISIVKAKKAWQKTALKFPALLLAEVATFDDDAAKPNDGALTTVACLKGERAAGERTSTSKVYSGKTCHFHRWSCCGNGSKKPHYHVTGYEQE